MWPEKVFFDEFLLILPQKDFDFFAKTCFMTVKKNLENLGTLPSMLLKILQKNTQNKQLRLSLDFKMTLISIISLKWI